MQLSDLTKEQVDRAIADLYATLSEHVSNVVYAVAWERYSIPKERRRLGPKEYPYWFAADIELLFRFAAGQAEASTSHIDEICNKILDLLHTAPLGRIEEDWSTLLETPLGVAIRAARGRIRLRSDDEMLSAREIALLSGLTSQKIAAAKMTKKRVRGTTCYAAPDVRALFEKAGVVI